MLCRKDLPKHLKIKGGDPIRKTGLKYANVSVRQLVGLCMRVSLTKGKGKGKGCFET